MFSEATLAAFEDAAASIVLRGIERAFERAGIRPVDDAGVGDAGGARRIAFRRYVASVDRRDPDARDRLGIALGALVAEVATSKVAYLVGAAERDGFTFADGAFRVASTDASSFAIVTVEAFGSIDEVVRRLRALANERPRDAVAGARTLVESTCRTLEHRDDPSTHAESLGLVELALATLASRDARVAEVPDDERSARVRAIARLCSVVEHLADPRVDLVARDARLAVDAAAAFTRYIAES